MVRSRANDRGRNGHGGQMGDLACVNGFTPEQIHRCRFWADRLRASGIACIPTRRDDKRPLLPSYSQYWEGGLPPVEDLWRRWPSGSMQAILGRSAGYCVVDVDGPEALDAWRKLWSDRGAEMPRTWVSSRDGRQGRHVWFRLPEVYRRGPYMPWRLLWGVWEPEAAEGRGSWRKRAKIELMADKRLVMVPPSIHPVTGQVYRWHRGAGVASPEDLRRPAPIPAWVLELDAEEDIRPRLRDEPIGSSPPRPSPRRPVRIDGEVQLPAAPSVIRGALPKIEVVRAWGVVLPKNARVNHEGWMRVHDWFKVKDDNPSAMFNPATGRYWRPEGFPGVADGRSICLFRLGVEMGAYATWHECAYDLARSYLPELFKRGK